MTDYTESVSGFKRTGTWGEIVEHGERISFALEELGIKKDEVDEYNDWRPKLTENVSTDINDKTAEKATMDKSGSENPKKEIKSAGEEITNTYKNFGEPEEAFRNWVHSIGYAAKAVDSITRKSIRNVEKIIYKNVMTVISPYYFDNNLISANIARINKKPHKYRLEVNINEDALKKDVSEKLESYESDYQRWHVSTEKDIDNVGALEGSETEEVPNQEEDPNPKVT